jgi:hypothetical protein
VGQDKGFFQAALPQTLPATTLEQFNVQFASFSPEDKIQEAIAALKRVLDKGGNALKNGICVDLRYCDRKGHELLKLLRDVAVLLATAGVITWHPIGLTAVLTAVVLLYKNGYFDELCECPKK